jgi:hypothetical protein
MTNATALPRPGLTVRGLGLAKSLVVGTMLSLTPLTSVLVLGWLTRRMAATIETRQGRTAPPPGWVLGPPGQGRVVRALGGLGANVRAGFLTLMALFLYTAPFTLLWLGAWWAGWENSFNKGYEQAWVGPLVFLSGTAVGLVLIVHLPFALAHMAAEGRWSAVFEWRRIRAVFAHAGWRAAWLSLATLGLALPLFAARGLPGLAGNFAASLESLSAEDLARVTGQIDLATAAWAMAALLFLRHQAALAYARAAAEAAGADPRLWAGARARLAANPTRLPRRTARAFWLALSLLPAAGLAFLILAGQFLNYGWHHWITHPFFVLPWPG